MREAEWIDISVPVGPGLTPVWPGAPPIVFERRLDLARGDEVTDTTISFSVHTGTHIDAPAHFLCGGTNTDAIQPSRLIGPCYVADLRGQEQISADALTRAKIPTATPRVLLRTDNSDRWAATFDPGFAGLTPEAARWVVERGIELLGIDYLSVQPFEGSRAVHEALLSAGVVVLEGLDLRGVEAQTYELICLPLALVGSEGAPARAMIRPISTETRLR